MPWGRSTVGHFNMGHFHLGTFWPMCTHIKMIPISLLIKHAQNILGMFRHTKMGAFDEITLDVLTGYLNLSTLTHKAIKAH